MKTGILLAGATWALLIVSIVLLAGCSASGSCDGKCDGSVEVQNPFPWAESQPSK